MISPLLIMGFLMAGAGEDRLRIEAQADPCRILVSVRLPGSIAKQLPEGRVTQDQGEAYLTLALLDSENGKPGPAILGNYQRLGTSLTFQPRHPLLPGHRYRAILVSAGNKPISEDYSVPKKDDTGPALVEKVFPSGRDIPANQLKFYIHFSRPMRQSREVFDRIELRTAKNQVVLAPWRRTELWSDDGKRLTLWIHPGRVKEGVNLREELGPVLEAGHRYTLVVRADMVDGEGRPLGSAFTREFQVGEPVRSRPLPADWKVQVPPTAGTREPLRVAFPRPLDRALMERCIKVGNSAGQPVAGSIAIGHEERSWTFQPADPWKDDRYFVIASDELEDLAGNTPRRVFDVDLKSPRPAPAQLSVPFQPSPGTLSKP